MKLLRLHMHVVWLIVGTSVEVMLQPHVSETLVSARHWLQLELEKSCGDGMATLPRTQPSLRATGRMKVTDE